MSHISTLHDPIGRNRTLDHLHLQANKIQSSTSTLNTLLLKDYKAPWDFSTPLCPLSTWGPDQTIPTLLRFCQYSTPPVPFPPINSHVTTPKPSDVPAVESSFYISLCPAPLVTHQFSDGGTWGTASSIYRSWPHKQGTLLYIPNSCQEPYPPSSTSPHLVQDSSFPPFYLHHRDHHFIDRNMWHRSFPWAQSERRFYPFPGCILNSQWIKNIATYICWLTTYQLLVC